MNGFVYNFWLYLLFLRETTGEMGKKGIVIAFFIISSSLFLYWGRNAYFDTNEQLLILTEQIFQSAIKDEATIRMRDVPQFIHHSFSPSEKSPSYDEILNHSNQHYLTRKDPCRLYLDSLFQQELMYRHVQARTGVRCIMGSLVNYSSTDSVFFEEAIQIMPVVYTSNLKVTDEKEVAKKVDPIELCAYVHFPFYFIVQRIPAISWVLFLWVVLQCAVILGFYFWKKWKQIGLSVFEAVTGDWTKLADNLLFNEKTGTLKYAGTSYSLRENRLKLFIALLHAPECFLTYEEILCQLKNRPPLMELSESDKSSLSMTVKRLKEDLAGISVIRIQAIRGKGYKLNVDSDYIRDCECEE